MMRRLPSIILPVVACALAGLGLWHALDVGPTLAGAIGGAASGAIAGVLATIGPPSPSPRTLGLQILGALAVAVAGLVIVTADLGSLPSLGDTLGTFLSVDPPVSGLDDLAALPYLVVWPAAAVAAWAARHDHPLLAVAAPTVALGVSALLAAPADVPLWVPLALAVVAGLHLLVSSRERYHDMPPLIGTSTAVRRQLSWWRLGAIGLPALALGAAAVAAPRAGAFDVRRFVEADLVVSVDENPLAVAARLRRDPPPSAAGLDATVTVRGESPGRLRLAVLDRYEPEGWRQRAEFAVTGSTLAADALGGDVDPALAASTVTVERGEATTGLRAAPTAGLPVASADPNGVRYSPVAGVLWPTAARATVAYTTSPRPAVAPASAAGAPVGVPVELYRCPGSGGIAEIASTLTEGATQPLDRLRRIEAWLKLTKVYDAQAPGGQTVASVERFLAQDFARGDLEVFVTAYALVARCAGVPARVVVGYPAPRADDRTAYAPGDVAAWVETPLAGIGWVPLDPTPTPAEQQRQAELARQPPPPPPPAPPPPPPGTVVDPVGIGGGSDRRALVSAGVGLLGVLAAVLAATATRTATFSRRRRVADPAVATRFAWRSVIEHLHDAGIELGTHLTASETARATAGRVPPSVTRLLSELAGLADRARYDAESTRPEHAELAWALADAALVRIPTTVRMRLAPLLHPRRWRRRLRLARGMPRRAEGWTGPVPETALVADDAVELGVPGYDVEARIGAGSTAVVYRARSVATGRPVAIKVFSFDLTDRRFDHQRFAWEARVAELVSGSPHLPEVLESGVTSAGQPYLVSELYERGTLLRRVQRGGPLSAGELASAGRQLASALATLHDNAIFHGDVKPENVFIDDDGSMVLGDLGAAWLRADGGPAASMTPPYAAPEVWLGHAATGAADIYSLGLTLMFAASGRAPMPGSPPSEDDVREAFAGSDLVVPLLEIDPRRRPRSAHDAARRFGADTAELTLGPTR